MDTDILRSKYGATESGDRNWPADDVPLGDPLESVEAEFRETATLFLKSIRRSLLRRV